MIPIKELLYMTSKIFVKNIEHESALKHVSGKAIYVDDISLQQKKIVGLDTEFLDNIINHENLIVLRQKKLLHSKFASFNKTDTNLLLMSSGNFSDLNIKNIFSD